MPTIDRQILDNALSYTAYRELVQNGLDQGKTTGPNQSPKMIEYTQLNETRMKRLDKKTKIQDLLADAVNSIDQAQTWLLITEAWCGDAAQIIPLVNKAAELNDNIELRLVLRDEHPQLMDQFLTNGARSIPILIILDANSLEVINHWGPRPAPAQAIAMNTKAQVQAEADETNRKEVYQAGAKDLQLWYARNKGLQIQEELQELILTVLEKTAS